MCGLVPKIPADHKKEIYLNKNEKRRRIASTTFQPLTRTKEARQYVSLYEKIPAAFA